MFVDCATLRKWGMRAIVAEVLVFSAGGIMISIPSVSLWLASLVGIGRGVDFVTYPTIIWLVRESILARHLRWSESDRMTALVRVLAMRSAQNRSAGHV